jgi:hypothetical protein
MSLPFLKKNKVSTGIAMEYRKPDEASEKSDPSDDSGLEQAFEDLMRAHANNDKKAGAAALRAAFQILDSEPHHEGSHLDESEE